MCGGERERENLLRNFFLESEEEGEVKFEEEKKYENGYLS